MNWKALLGFGLLGAWLYVWLFRPDIQAIIQGIGALGEILIVVVALIVLAGTSLIHWLRTRMAAQSADVGQSRASQHKRRVRLGDVVSYIVAATILFFYFGLHLFVPEIYRGLTALRGDDFISDYMEASTERRLDFQRNICGDISCFTELDFLCGFSIGSNEFEYEAFREAFDECFYEELRLAHPRDYLGEIVLTCGRKNMYFDPSPSELVNPERCEAKGGVWGAAVPIAD